METTITVNANDSLAFLVFKCIINNVARQLYFELAEVKSSVQRRCTFTYTDRRTGPAISSPDIHFHYN